MTVTSYYDSIIYDIIILTIIFTVEGSDPPTGSPLFYSSLADKTALKI